MPAAWVAGAAALYSGISGSSAAKKQASQQKKALALQAMQYNENKQNMTPYIQGGKTAMDQYMNQLGIGSGPAMDITQTPGYADMMKQGLAAVNQGGAGAGMLMSGERLKGLQSTGQSIFGNYYNSYMDRLAGLQTQGMNASNSLAGNQGAMIGQMTDTRGRLGDYRAQQTSQMAQGISGALGAYAGSKAFGGSSGSLYGGSGSSAPMEFNLSSIGL